MPALVAALVLLAAPAAAAPPAAAPYDWGTDAGSVAQVPQFAASRGVCRSLGLPHPPAADLPTPTQRAALKGCDAEALYSGTGAKPDYVRARLCALSEPPRDTFFNGAAILTEVYANGLGVARNLDLATAYACTIQGAAAEDDGRVKHLQSLKSRPEKGRFDICDDITSGYAQGFCAARASKAEAVGRDARLAALVARLPAAARPLYPPMKAAFDAFVKAHGEDEVDLSGTARAAEVIGEQDTVRAAFAASLAALLDGRWPPASPAQAQAADAALNAAYRQALAFTGSKANYSTVKPEGVRAAERAWLAWRDAFTAFARAASPGTSPAAVQRKLSADRTAQLRALAG